MIASQTGLRKETILFTLNIYYQTPLWTKEVFTASSFFFDNVWRNDLWFKKQQNGVNEIFSFFSKKICTRNLNLWLVCHLLSVLSVVMSEYDKVKICLQFCFPFLL